MTTITLNKDGTGRKDVDIASLTIPDLWHVAEYLDDCADETTSDSKRRRLKVMAENVRAAWSLAHDMKRHIEGY